MIDRMEPAEALDQVAFALEVAAAPTYRVAAFRKAAATVRSRSSGDIRELAEAGRLRSLPGIGEATASVIAEALDGQVPTYLTKVQSEFSLPGGGQTRSALRGDCHVHSDWSDGGSSIETMATTAQALGHQYFALTDHSPRLKVANGLSPERLTEQLELVESLNRQLAPFRILTGIEVDILDDGTLDQDPALLNELDIVVGSVHSKLRMDARSMTRRLVAAIANPNLDILGHCTGRLLGKTEKQSRNRRAHEGKRAESEFDAEMVFAAIAHFDKALEINSRPERLDPPRRLLTAAVDAGCRFTIDSDAHAPGQMAWLVYGCERAEETGVQSDRILNTRSVDEILSWTASHGES